MKRYLMWLPVLVAFFIQLEGADVHFSMEDCLFVKGVVPEKGIVCSNAARARRLAQHLENPEFLTCSWGPFVAIGKHHGEKIFVAAAPVGTGAGLVFTELYTSGAKAILRYGSDDVKKPPESDVFLVKIVDEADNLYGFTLQSGAKPSELGASIFASPSLVKTLQTVAQARSIEYEMRVCHHLENYHALRAPEKLSLQRSRRIQEMLSNLEKHPKAASFDMETAVLFQVAKDFGLHAATVLQTVNKESSANQKDDERTKEVEETIFFDFVFEALHAFMPK